MKRALALGVVTGCFSIPPYEPEVAVAYVDAPTGASVTGPGFALHFAGGAGFHFPDALTIDGADVMGRAPAPACFDASETGLQISPTPRISADGGAMPVSNRLSPTLRGPAVVQARLDWATRFECNIARTPGGRATFTVFPDGRIVRYDTLVDPVTTPIYPTMCACDTGQLQFTVSMYWTFARGAFRDLYAPDRGALPTSTDPVIPNLATSCIDDGARQLAVAWPEPYGTTIRGSDAVIGFGHDLVFGASMLDELALHDRSALIVERGGCAAAVARAREHIQPSPLAINGVATLPAVIDGIYGGDGGDGAPGIPLASDRAELIGPVASSFAVWLRFPRAVEALRATREGATGPWYVPQQVDDRTWIVWFRDSISAAQHIVIEPR